MKPMSSLRGDEAWPPEEVRPKGTQVPLSKKRCLEYWGKDLPMFGVKVLHRIRQIAGQKNNPPSSPGSAMYLCF